MTNRDKINKLDNSELAAILIWTGATDRCKFCCYTRERCLGKSCFESIKMWLSTPCANEPEKPSAEHVDLQEVSERVCDNVNHPSHYNHGKIEVIDFIEDQHLGFHLGNAVKYISRAGRKDPARTVEDLRKAAWYLNRQIERLEGGLSGQNS